jgi:ATP-binding cassette, subfamily B, bacterial
MSFSRVFHYYWPQVKKYKWSFFLVFFGYGGGILFANILNPYLYKRIIDLISAVGFSEALSGDLYQIAFWIVLSVIGFSVFYRIGDYAIVYFESNVIREINNDAFTRVLNHSHKFFSNNFSGSLVAKAKRFSASFERLNDIISFSFWFVIIELSGVFLVLLFSAPRIGLLFLLWVVIYIVITLLFIRIKIRYDLLEAESDSKVTARFADSITNILNVKIFSGINFEQTIFKDVTSDQYVKRKKAGNFWSFQNAVQTLLMAGLEIAVIYLLINLWLKDSITTGMFVLVQFYMLNIFHRLWDLGRSLARFFKSLADAKEMTDIFDQVPDILDIANPEKCRISKGEIEFKDVNFEYVPGFSVFKSFNLKIQPGEKVGLVGHSGSGKSTIVKMLLRFADVGGGEILIDGQNVARLRQDDLRDQISYVPQEPILFHRPISENIAYSKPNATQEEILIAAQSAHAHEFIENLPQGYNTLVGERGIKLSGGERQRIAIARAMLKNVPVLVLDEATSSLDSVSESYIQDAFGELMKGKTTIVIAHRLSTIQKMDRIIVLDKGEIVEEGTHKELLGKKGLYADLWEHQTGGFLE